MVEQPTGTVTLLFTDIEGSTALLQRLGTERYAEALDLHRRLLREAFERHGGYEVDFEGDAFFVAFRTAGDAVAAAADAQRALAEAVWPEQGAIRVRMGIHTGEPMAAPPKYVGLDVHTAARVMASGYGGQVLLTKATEALLDGLVAVRELGTHRLKDLLQPEPLYQLLVPGLREEFPALKTLGNRPHNLPVVATAFIGREQELAAVQKLLDRDEVRLLTLTGPGGIGKTRLALQAAAEAVDRFRDGVFWVSLASLRDPALLAATVGRTLGLREEAGESGSETIGRYLAEKRLLLVLDNLEHLAPAARALAADLLAAAPGLRVLATSRETLRIRAEQLYDVPPLAIPEAGKDSAQPSDAVALFAARAQATDSNFVLSSQPDVALVGEIVRRLDGLPLAIELAAARVRTLSLAALVELLDDRLRLLTAGAYDADERQRTLRATIEWSHDLLTSNEQTVFARLSIFVGGCSIAAAQAVCDPNRELGVDIFDAVDSLLEKSLLRRREDPDGRPRYWMLETIREYGESRRKLSLSEHDLALRHARYFLECARVAEGTPQYVDRAASSRLAPDLPNLRVALATLSRERGMDFRNFAASLARFFEQQGLLAEGEEWLRLALSVSTAVDLPTARLRTGLAKLAIRRGDLSLGADEADRAVEAARRSGDKYALAVALLARAIPPKFTGEFKAARALIDEAFEVLEGENADVLLAMALVDLTDLAMNERDWAEASALAERALEKARTADPAAEALSHLNLGISLIELNEPSKAAESLATGIRLGNDLGIALFVAYALTRFAQTLEHDDPLRAARLLGAADALQTQLGAVKDPIEIEAASRTTARLRERLTSASFDAQYAEGKKLDQAAAVHLALTPSHGPPLAVQERGAE